MSSDLWVKSGIYDPTKLFAFTNITEEPFTFTWGGSPITVKAGETVKLRHHLAVLATTRLVDKIMTEDIHQEEVRGRKEKNDPLFRSTRGASLGVPAARKPIEDKILRELPPESSTDSQLGVIRSEIQEQFKADLAGKPSPAIGKMSDIGVSGMKEFEDVNLPKSSS